MKKVIGFLMSVVFICALSCLISNSADAQSLSDFQWDNFVENASDGDVRAHTDPFASGMTSAEDLSIEELQLSGIVYYDDNEAYALISGYLVKPGDKIAGYRVDLVEKDRIRLRRVDDIFVLSMGGGI